MRLLSRDMLLNGSDNVGTTFWECKKNAKISTFYVNFQV